MMISIGGGIFVEVEFLRYVSNILYEFDYIRTELYLAIHGRVEVGLLKPDLINMKRRTAIVIMAT